MTCCREPKHECTEMGSLKPVGRTRTTPGTFPFTSKAQSIWALLIWIFTENRNYILFPTYAGALQFRYNEWGRVPRCLETNSTSLIFLLCWTSFWPYLLSFTKHLFKLPASHIMHCFEINLQPDCVLQIISLHPKTPVGPEVSDWCEIWTRKCRGSSIGAGRFDRYDFQEQSGGAFCGAFYALRHRAFAKSLLCLSGSGEKTAWLIMLH